jgi:hypothetical protein
VSSHGSSVTIVVHAIFDVGSAVYTVSLQERGEISKPRWRVVHEVGAGVSDERVQLRDAVTERLPHAQVEYAPRVVMVGRWNAIGRRRWCPRAGCPCWGAAGRVVVFDVALVVLALAAFFVVLFAAVLATARSVLVTVRTRARVANIPAEAVTYGVHPTVSSAMCGR